MDPKPLPARPSLEQYKKQAKELLKAYRSANVETIRRVKRNHPRFEKLAEPEFDISKFALADAQLVIAREHGFESWPKFAKRIEIINSEAAALANPVAAFIEAAIWHGTLDAADAILCRASGDPPNQAFTWRRFWEMMQRCGGSSLLIHETPQRKKRRMKATRWYIFASQSICGWRKRGQTAFLRAATALLDAGADPNTGFTAKDEYGDFETALYGAAAVAQHAELTRLLLERGADPNDNETFYHAPETYDNQAMKVLVESGKMRPDRVAGMLLRKADWHDYDGMKYLLEHGADPNLMTMWGYTALHQALRRDNALRNIELMLEHGADPTIKTSAEVRPIFTPDFGGKGQRSSFVIAAHRGRTDVLTTLERRGFALEFSGIDRLIAACAINDANAVRSIVTREPHLVKELLARGSTLLAEFAGNGNTKGVQILLDFGVPVDALYEGDPYFDIAKDSTALHVAAWKAWPKTVKLLIERGANVKAQDAKGRTPLMLAVKACVNSHWTNRRSPESVEVLLKAGASVSGIDFPSGYAEVDELLQQYANNSAANARE